MQENNHRWGKDHCMAGLQFYKVALDCINKYKYNNISFIGQFQLNWRPAVQWYVSVLWRCRQK